MTTTTAERSALAITEEDAARLFLDARTAYRFTDEPVTEEHKRTIYGITKMGPTAFNSQPLRITWLETPEARERLVQHMSGSNKEKTRNAPLTAILAYDENWHTRFPEFFPAAPQLRSMYDENEQLRLTSAMANSHIQVGYFIVAARAAGLAAGPMTGFDADAVDREFFAGTGKRSIVVVNLGHPVAPDVERTPRFPEGDVTETL